GLDTFMRIRDDELDTTQTARGECAQECGPECLRLRWTDIHAQDLATAIAVDSDCDDHCHRDDAPALAHLHIGRVDPQIRPRALDRAAQEGFDLLVDLDTEPAHLAFGDAAHPHRLDQVIDGAGRHSAYVGLLPDCRY